MSHHAFAEGQLFPMHHQLCVGTHSWCIGMAFTCHIQVTSTPQGIAGNQHRHQPCQKSHGEMPVLSDHNSWFIATQSLKGEVLSYHF